MKIEKPESIYDEDGRIKDPGIARIAAYEQKPFMEKKRFGIFPPGERSKESGAERAREVAETYERMYDELKDVTVEIDNPVVVVKRWDNKGMQAQKNYDAVISFEGKIKGVDVKIRGSISEKHRGIPYSYDSFEGTLDGDALSGPEIYAILDKYRLLINIETNKIIYRAEEQVKRDNEKDPSLQEKIRTDNEKKKKLQEVLG